MSARLDDEKLETLRRWGAGLGADGRDELRAAGKAILILIDEIERLQVDAWHMRDGSRESRAPTALAELTLDEDEEAFLAVGATDGGLELRLRSRLRGLLHARPAKTE